MKCDHTEYCGLCREAMDLQKKKNRILVKKYGKVVERSIRLRKENERLEEELAKYKETYG